MDICLCMFASFYSVEQLDAQVICFIFVLLYTAYIYLYTNIYIYINLFYMFCLLPV